MDQQEIKEKLKKYMAVEESKSETTEAEIKPVETPVEAPAASVEAQEPTPVTMSNADKMAAIRAKMAALKGNK